MRLITKEIEKTLPPLYSCEQDPNPLLRVKIFAPFNNWEWYILEYDPETRECFGLVNGFDQELGYFSLDELESINIHGMKLERDRYFIPCNLKTILD